MIDWINRIFAALARVHSATYALVGGACTASLYTFLLGAQTYKDWLIVVVSTGCFVFLVNGFLPRIFYEKYELGRKYLPLHHASMVLFDTYFYTKINSNMTLLKKMAGYFYVIFRAMANIYLGFYLFLAAFLLIKKGLGL